MLTLLTVILLGLTAAGVVTSIARQKKDRDIFGVGAVAFFTAASLGLLGMMLFGFIGGLGGSIIGGIIIEEIVRAKKPLAKNLVFCSQCGFKQQWVENKNCENCGEFLRG
jgi:uncharacterized membrane protein YraQ (UPF0718 family)